MYYREENKYMHRARVLISSCGKNQYNRILNIIPEISTNDAHEMNILYDTILKE